MSDKRRLLLIFVKNPEKGKVKTRLAKKIGDKEALNVYRKLLFMTKEVVKDVDCEKQVWYSSFIPDKDLWNSQTFGKHIQQGHDLGERMSIAFKNAFQGGAPKVVLIGSDCAELTKDIIENAFQALEHSDVVIGPSFDGGYYLLGMSSFEPDLFENIAWSTPSVFEQTIAKAGQLHLSIAMLPRLNDIDTQEDLRQSDSNLIDL